MGSCSSLYYEDDEDIKALKKKQKREAKELREFSNQLRKQQTYYSELDLLGKGTSSRQKKQQIKKQQNIKEKGKQRQRTEKRQATSEQIRIAKDILYDV